MSTKRQRSPTSDKLPHVASKRFHDGGLSQAEGAPHRQPPSLSHADYDIAWICALSLELAASRAMLDEEHEFLAAHDGDDNIYILGRIAQHNVVMVALPLGYGKIKAANVSKDLKRSFPNIRATLMVGIGGGAPAEADLYLGDVVVGTRVMEYDLGKAVQTGQFNCTETPKIPSPLLRSAIVNLQAKHGMKRSSLRSQELMRTKAAAFPHPAQPDRLFQASYPHPPNAPTCDDCEKARLQHRQARPDTDFYIHYGVVASGDSVNKDSQKRDKVSRELTALCFEMEAAGIMDNLHCLPIRGICDYSDSHKNKVWQPYAAATAAAYARELLETIPAQIKSHGQPVNADSGYFRIPSSADDERTQRRIACLEMLDFPQINARKDAIRAEQSKTCRWFLEQPKYRAWMSSGTLNTPCSRLLWVRGKAGAGKSTMMKFLYSEVRKKKKKPTATVVSFFFNARGEYLEKSIAGMYRSLLKQTLTQFPDLQFVLDDMEVASPNVPSNPSLNVLKELFRDMIMALGSKSLTCFIDALDECNENDVRDMVQLFEELTDMAEEETIQFRVCFASRPYPYIQVDEEYLLTLENEAGHAEDLAKYVNKCLKVPTKMQAELQSLILEKSSGVFLWVVLVVGILNKESTYGGFRLRKRLTDIPATLSELFTDILQKDKARPKELQRCIMWVLCSFRPLTSSEFCHAMWAAGLEDGDVDDELPDVEDDETKMALVTSSSKGLVEVTNAKKTGSRVQFIHESVRDFLIKEKGIQQLWPDLGFEWEGISHELIRGCCESYLMNPAVRAVITRFRKVIVPVHSEETSVELESDCDDPDATPSGRQPTTLKGKSYLGTPTAGNTPPKQYAFLEYATQHILEHADKAAAASIPQKDFLSRFFEDLGNAALDCGQTVKVRRYGPTASQTYIMADRGLASLLLDAEPEVAHDRRLRFHHPFFAAVANGHQDIVALLLGLSSIFYEGENLMQGLGRVSNLKHFKNRSPLSWACQEGRVKLIKALARNTEQLTHADPAGLTPIQRISSDSPELAEFIRPIILEGLDVDQHTKTLAESASRGQLQIVQMIIQKGVDVNASGQFGDTALMFASKNGHLAVVQLLLDSGAIVDAANFWMTTALIIASENGHRAIAELLLHYGANVNTAQNMGYTALILASQNGHQATIELLLDCGADINVSDNSGQTALMRASGKGHVASILLLLNRGANVDALDNQQRTAHHSAATYNHREAMNLLYRWETQKWRM